MAETSTQAPVAKTCPNCGQKVLRQDMSNCAYCAMPFDLGGKSEAKQPSAIQARLARMRDHAEWPEAQGYTPPVEADLELATRQIRGGAFLVAVGVLLLLWGTVTGIGPARLALGIVALAVGAPRLLKGFALRRARLRLPLLRRAALVSNRRSETSLGWMDGKTTYYFHLELEDGGSGEFRYPGRGVQDDLLVKGNTGVAYTRGDELVAFKHIKV